MLAWPAGCALLAGMLWSATEHSLSYEAARAREAARDSAAALAFSYAEQLQRSIQLLDQITMQLKYSWEYSAGLVDLAEQRRQGLFPNSSLLYVNLFSAAGELISTSVENPRPVNVADREFFHAHASARQPIGLHISAPFTARMTGRSIISLTRALRAADGSFAGLAAVSVEPAWLSAYYDLHRLGNRDVLLVQRNDGAVLAATAGGARAGAAPLPGKPFLPDQPKGLLELPGSAFQDEVPRFLAWHSLQDYPLTAMAGIAIPDALREVELAAQRSRGMTWAATAVLFLLALVGMAFTVRLEWRRHQAEQLRSLYGVVGDDSTEAIYLVAPVLHRKQATGDWQIIDCNARAAELYGVRRAQLLGRKLSSFFNAERLAKIGGLLERAQREGSHEDEYQVPPESAVRAAWLRRKYVHTPHGVAIMLSDISERKAQEATLSKMANTDELTGLPNRQWLNAYLPCALTAAARDGKQLALLFLDLDDFKNINDTQGHDAGDELLRQAAARLRAVIRPGDNAVRLGGDEFTILLEGIGSEQAVGVAAERIARALRQPWPLPDGRLHEVQASVGVAIFPRDGEDAATLLRHADIAMYAAKAHGKANCQFFRPQLSDALVEKLNARQVLREAISRSEFLLHFQPRVDCTSGEIRGLEALLRWKHPARGLVPAGEFIGLAEETDVAAELGQLALRLACGALADWRDQGLPLEPVSVNLSARHLARGSVASAVQQALAAHALESRWLQVEVPEPVLLAHAGDTSAQLVLLRQAGANILVDHFGSAASAMAQLQQLEVGVIKLDRSLVAPLGATPDQSAALNTEALVMGVVSMAHVLGMQVVAQGVETLAQLKVLQMLACNQVQGYLVCAPVPGERVPELLTQPSLLPRDACRGVQPRAA